MSAFEVSVEQTCLEAYEDFCYLTISFPALWYRTLILNRSPVIARLSICLASFNPQRKKRERKPQLQIGK